MFLEVSQISQYSWVPNKKYKRGGGLNERVINNLILLYINKSTMATKLELTHLDHKIYSAIKQIGGQK